MPDAYVENAYDYVLSSHMSDCRPVYVELVSGSSVASDFSADPTTMDVGWTTTPGPPSHVADTASSPETR